jgi:hypothetical protein
MLTGLGVTLSAAAKAMSTHGKEGGAQDVVAYQQQLLGNKRAAEDQAMKKSEFDLRSKAMTAKMQQDSAIYAHNVSQWGVEGRTRQLGLHDATVESFVKDKKAAADAGYDLDDPGQRAEFEKLAGVGGAAQQPGAIVVPFVDGHSTGDAVANVRGAIPGGKSSADYIPMVSYQDKTVTLVPKDSALMGMPATPRQISTSRAETEAMLTEARAIPGMTSNPCSRN